MRDAPAQAPPAPDHTIDLPLAGRHGVRAGATAVVPNFAAARGHHREPAGQCDVLADLMGSFVD